MKGFGLFFLLAVITSAKGKLEFGKKSKCPDVFIPLGGGCYHFGSTAASWFQAWQQCSLLGASLVSFETETEWNMIIKYIKTIHPTRKTILNPDNKTLAITAAYWTSGTDLTRKNNWIWLGSGLPIFNTDWCPGQPDNKNGIEHCIKLLTSGDNHCWNDRNCFTRDTATNGTHTSYICEINRSTYIC